MIYKDIDQFTSQAKINSNSFILLDLSLLNYSILQQKICSKATELQCDTRLLKEKFEDIFIGIDDLSNKIGGVILPLNCFSRTFTQFNNLDQTQTHSAFSFLRMQYQKTLLIGLKIQFDKIDQFFQLKDLQKSGKIKFFSFDLQESQLEQQLLLMRNCVKILLSKKKKIFFHINIRLKSIFGLKLLKQELLTHQYPIEYCCLQTNLLNLIETTYGFNFQANWQEIAFKYCQSIKKYIPSAIGCLLQFYQSTNGHHMTSNELNGLYQCINIINKREESTLQKEYKPYHNTGICVFESTLLNLLDDFSIDQYSHYKTKGTFDSIDLVQIHKALMGKHQSTLIIHQ